MKYDVVVIGGGPAGMLASGRAGQENQSVLLVEKNKELGIKLLMTGKDRCNLTHYSEIPNELIEAYGKNGKFLYSSLANFSNLDVINFFKEKGVATKIERGNRVFPASDKSSDVRQALLNFMRDNSVGIKSGQAVKKIIICRGRSSINKIILKNGKEIEAKKFIIATGGLSYPTTGSTGDGYEWARQLGHTIIIPRPALSPLILKNDFIKYLEGLSLRNIEISVFENNKKTASDFGEMLFTKRGISGPTVLNISKTVGQLLLKKSTEITIKIDLKPALDFKKLDQRIQRDFQAGNNKQFKNILDKLLPKKIIPTIIKLSKINPDKSVNLITKKERQNLTLLLKEFPLSVDRLVGFDKAIITTGGISLKEVDSKTMQSKIIDNLYFTGEVLDLDGPTGGYNLQVCWSTAWTAGSNH